MPSPFESSGQITAKKEKLKNHLELRSTLGTSFGPFESYMLNQTMKSLDPGKKIVVVSENFRELAGASAIVNKAFEKAKVDSLELMLIMGKTKIEKIISFEKGQLYQILIPDYEYRKNDKSASKILLSDFNKAYETDERPIPMFVTRSNVWEMDEAEFIGRTVLVALASGEKDPKKLPHYMLVGKKRMFTEIERHVAEAFSRMDSSENLVLVSFGHFSNIAFGKRDEDGIWTPTRCGKSNTRKRERDSIFFDSGPLPGISVTYLYKEGGIFSETVLLVEKTTFVEHRPNREVFGNRISEEKGKEPYFDEPKNKYVGSSTYSLSYSD